MLHFLHPIWLTAMAGILFPVVLHLWNDRRGKVLRVGSISLLQGASRRMSLSRKLSQWWLLVLRCLLLLLLALLLAGPYWQRPAGRETRKGWVLASAGPGVYGSLIDSLVKAGYEKHELADTAGVNYWEEFREADKEAPEGVDFYIVSTGLAGRYAGVRPVTGRVVHWYTHTPVDSVSHWTERAWLLASSRDSVRVSEGNSRATGTSYHDENRPKVMMGSQRLVIDTTTLRITIYTDPAYRQDGKYLTAAVKALESFTQRRMRINNVGVVPAVADTEWLFWLSTQPLPRARWGHVWRYAAGRDTVLDSRIEGTEVMKEVVGASGEGVWKDGYGRGVLRREGTEYQFYSRLDPAWNGLVWDRKFPVLLGKLLLGEGTVPVLDRRVLDPGQVAPVYTTGVRLAGAASMTDLAQVFWILLFLLFILERVVSFTINSQKKDG